MTREELTRIVRRFLHEEWYPNLETVFPKGDIPYATGDWRTDGILHYLNEECGMNVTVTIPSNLIESYEVTDEQKFAWFILSWS